MVFKYNQMRKQKAGRDKISKIEKSIEKDKIDQIKDEERELNKIEKENLKQEKEERQRLREMYLTHIRGSFGAMLDHTVIRYPDGTEQKVSELKKTPDSHKEN